MQSQALTLPLVPTLQLALTLQLEVRFDPPITIGLDNLKEVSLGNLLETRFDPFIKVSRSDLLKAKFKAQEFTLRALTLKLAHALQLEVGFNPLITIGRGDLLKVKFDPFIKVSLSDLIKARFKARFNPFTKSTKFKSTEFKSFYKLEVIKKVLQINLLLVI